MRPSFLAPDQDAFGQMLLDHLENRRGPAPRLERDDGWSGPAMSASEFFVEPSGWPRVEHALLAHAHGRVLDLGAGAGRHSLDLQTRGHDVTAVDYAPGAIEVCRRRGVHDALLSDIRELPSGEPFDTILLLCGNLGLAGTRTATRGLLRDLWERSVPGGVILADSVDPLASPSPEHQAYHAASPKRGRDVGQVRIRLRYGTLCTPWFDLYNVPRDQLHELLVGTGWRVSARYDEGVSYGVQFERLAVRE